MKSKYVWFPENSCRSKEDLDSNYIKCIYLSVDQKKTWNYLTPLYRQTRKTYKHTMAQAGDQQQFCLRWNDFQTNMVSSFKHLRDEKSFTDVTLGKT